VLRFPPLKDGAKVGGFCMELALIHIKRVILVEEGRIGYKFKDRAFFNFGRMKR